MHASNIIQIEQVLFIMQVWVNIHTQIYIHVYNNYLWKGVINLKESKKGCLKKKSEIIIIISKEIFKKETNNNNKNNNTECCGSCLCSQHLGGRGGGKRDLKPASNTWDHVGEGEQKQWLSTSSHFITILSPISGEFQDLGMLETILVHF